MNVNELNRINSEQTKDLQEKKIILSGTRFSVIFIISVFLENVNKNIFTLLEWTTWSSLLLMKNSGVRSELAFLSLLLERFFFPLYFLQPLRKI